jgi:hypothetical protein
MAATGGGRLEGVSFIVERKRRIGTGWAASVFGR